MPEISIIVPVFNAGQYLRRCVDSILSQSFTDFELILVDDGSTDGSGSICDEYAANDVRISVVHTSNKGAAAARNEGLSRIKGDYIMFCDSDDAVSPLWIERLYHYICLDRSVLPIGAYCSDVFHLGTSSNRNISKDVMFDSSEYFEFMRSDLAGYLWNALYRPDVIQEHHICFQEHKVKGDFNEDLLFTLAYVRHIKYIIYTGFADYCYIARDNSLSKSYQEYYFEKYAEKYKLWKQYIIETSLSDTDIKLSNLATMMLPHFIIGLHQEVQRVSLRRHISYYNRFCSIIRAPAVQDCLCHADTSKENPRIIRFITTKRCKTLWIYLLLHKLKGRIIK